MEEEKTKSQEKNTKTEEQIREEIKAELQKEAEIKEKAKKELKQEQLKDEMDQYEYKKKKRTAGKIIYHVITTALFLFVLFETIMGILDMKKLNDQEEPLWYIEKKVEVVETKTETMYNLGLYVIDKVEGEGMTKITLKPFFLKGELQ